MTPILAPKPTAVRASPDVFAPIPDDFQEAERIPARTRSSERPTVNHLVNHVTRFRGNRDLTEGEYLGCIDGKAADLTGCCCRLGAVFAGAKPQITESLARYGRALGIAFQIADDLLDLIGEEQTTGKSLGTDVAQQK